MASNPPPPKAGQAQTAYKLKRDLTKNECPWLNNDLPQGTIIYHCTKPTYGAVSRAGCSMTLDSTGDYPGFEVPHDAYEIVASATEKQADKTVAQCSIEQLIGEVSKAARASAFVGNHAIGSSLQNVSDHLLTETQQVFASHSSLLASHERLKQICEKFESNWPVWMGTPETKTALDELRTALSTAHSVNNG